MASQDPPESPRDPDDESSGEDLGRQGARDEGEPFPGWSILRGDSPVRVLDRIIDDDPLDIYLVCEERLRMRAILLDEHRLTLRAMARTAYLAPRYRGEPPLAQWLAERADDAIQELVDEDSADELRCAPVEEPWDERYSFLAEAIGATASVARTLCVRFNGLADDVRHAFHNVTIQGKSLHRYVAEGHGPPARVNELLRRAAEAFADGTDLNPREPDTGEPGDDEHGSGGDLSG